MNFTSFVVDICSLTNLARNVPAVSLVDRLCTRRTVPVLQMTLGGMVHAIVLVARVRP